MKPTEGSSPKCGECGEELGACPGCWAGLIERALQAEKERDEARAELARGRSDHPSWLRLFAQVQSLRTQLDEARNRRNKDGWDEAIATLADRDRYMRWAQRHIRAGWSAGHGDVRRAEEYLIDQAPKGEETRIETDLIVGDKVIKVGGDYSIHGTIVSVFTKLHGDVRYVVEDERGLLLIYSRSNLRLAPREAK